MNAPLGLASAKGDERLLPRLLQAYVLTIIHVHVSLCQKGPYTGSVFGPMIS